MSTLAEIPAGIYNITEVTLIGQILPTLLFCVPVTALTFIPLNFPVLIAVPYCHRSSRRTQRLQSDQVRPHEPENVLEATSPVDSFP